MANNTILTMDRSDKTYPGEIQAVKDLSFKLTSGSICALLHDPELIILDEPTAGLDPAARVGIWDIITGLNRKGKTAVQSGTRGSSRLVIHMINIYQIIKVVR